MIALAPRMPMTGQVLSWFDQHGGGVSALAAVLTAVIAIVTLISAGLDSRSRTQPVVIAELRYSPHSDISIDLVVRNLGPTVARDVQVEFDPPLEQPTVGSAGEGKPTSAIIERYSKPISMLAPSQELSNTWWLGVDHGGDKRVNGESTPDHVTVKISHRGRGFRRIRAAYPIDVSTMMLETRTESSSSTKGRIGSIEKSLKDIAHTLSQAARKR